MSEGGRQGGPEDLYLFIVLSDGEKGYFKIIK